MDPYHKMISNLFMEAFEVMSQIDQELIENNHRDYTWEEYWDLTCTFYNMIGRTLNEAAAYSHDGTTPVGEVNDSNKISQGVRGTDSL